MVSAVCLSIFLCNFICIFQTEWPMQIKPCRNDACPPKSAIIHSWKEYWIFSSLCKHDKILLVINSHLNGFTLNNIHTSSYCQLYINIIYCIYPANDSPLMNCDKPLSSECYATTWEALIFLSVRTLDLKCFLKMVSKPCRQLYISRKYFFLSADSRFYMRMTWWRHQMETFSA